MSRISLPASAMAVLLGSAAYADVPSVAVDIAPVHSLVARVMDGVGEPDLVIPTGASPHEYNLRPSEAAALQNADVVFWVGEDLTPWLEDGIETLAADADVVELLAADFVTLLDFREGALFEAHSHGDHEGHDHDEHGHDDHGHEDHDDHDHQAHGDHDHDHEEHAHEDHDEHDHEEHAEEDHDHDHEEHADDHDHDHEEHADDHDHDHEEHEEHADHEDHDHEEHGDHDHDHEDHDHDHDHEDHAGHDGHAHGEHDPHAWLMPANASAWLTVIAAELSEADPENAEAYAANAAAAQAELEALSAEIDGILEPVRGQSFVVFHDAYQYFETAFDIAASGAISLSDAADPSPARIAEIQGRIRDESIQCVLSEPQFNPGLVATVMDGTEANTAVLDPLGSDLELGPELYPNLLRNLATSLAGCF